MDSDDVKNFKRQIDNYKNEVLLQIDRNHKCEAELKRFKDNYNTLRQIYTDSSSDTNKVIEKLRKENESIKKENETIKKENELLKSELKELKNSYNIQPPITPLISPQISENGTGTSHIEAIQIEDHESCNTDSQATRDQRVRDLKIEMMNDVADLDESINQTQVLGVSNNDDDNDSDVILIEDKSDGDDECVENANMPELDTPSASDDGLFNSVDSPDVVQKCPCCPHKTKRKDHLKSHFRKYHFYSRSRGGKRTYKCHICDELFNDVKQLAFHLLSTHDNKDAFKCGVCGCLFKLHNQCHLHVLSHRKSRNQFI